MRVLPLLSFLLTVILSGVVPAQSPSFDRVEVERIITALASDEMAGRQTFTPGADRAAEFIANEFSDIGLTELDGAPGYRQRFQMYRVAAITHRVVLNGAELPADRYAVTVSSESVRFASTDDIDVVTVGPNDNLAEALSSLGEFTGNLAVLVDEQHSAMFGMLHTFLSRPNSVQELGELNAVWILTSETNPTLEVEITSSVEEMGLGNVVGMIPGRRSDQIVLFSAHYDHIGIQLPQDGDSIANGANDDASGTTAVIMLARYFKELGPQERTIMFAAFTGEEVGGYGSRHFSSRVDPDQIVAMFNIEMIGKPATDGPNSAWITGFERSDFGPILQRAVEGTKYRFYADPYPEQNLFYRSDNATLASLGVPAHSISTTPIDVDADYHQVSDEVSTLDLDHLANTIGAVAAGAVTIVSGAETPTRVGRNE